jgi:hypothetical protein
MIFSSSNPVNIDFDHPTSGGRQDARPAVVCLQGPPRGRNYIKEVTIYEPKMIEILRPGILKGHIGGWGTEDTEDRYAKRKGSRDAAALDSIPIKTSRASYRQRRKP